MLRRIDQWILHGSFNSVGAYRWESIFLILIAHTGQYSAVSVELKIDLSPLKKKQKTKKKTEKVHRTESILFLFIHIERKFINRATFKIYPKRRDFAPLPFQGIPIHPETELISQWIRHSRIKLHYKNEHFKICSFSLSSFKRNHEGEGGVPPNR